MVQFCSRDPTELASAVRLVEGLCDAVDLNIGCPQRTALRDGIGAALLDEPRLVRQMVAAVRAEGRVPIFCKMRVLPTLEVCPCPCPGWSQPC